MTKFNFKLIHNFDIVTRCNDNNRHNFCESQYSMMQNLKEHRDNIDAIDRQIAELLGKRFRIAEQVAGIKHQNNIPVRIEKRITEVLDNAKKHEIEFHLPPQLGYFLWRIWASRLLRSRRAVRSSPRSSHTRTMCAFLELTP